MKKIFFTASLVACYVMAFAQNVVTESNGRVTVRNANDSIITQIDSVGSGATGAAFNSDKSEIVVTYTNGNVLVKNTDGSTVVQIAEPTTDNAVSAVWSGNNVIITTQSNQTLSKNSAEWKQ